MVFESVPNSQPLLAKAKADELWGRTAVEGTVRAWYRYMSTNSPASAAKIKAEWDARFDGLPTDGDTNLLADERKLKWADLPRRQVVPAAAAAADNAACGTGVTGGLENPRVNPITGQGRSSTDVQHDLDRYRRNVRATASETCPALFQADYLFNQLPGCPLALHRVVHGLLIDDATDPNLRFTSAEYVHSAQDGVPGLWGTFEKKENPLYDPKDPRKGTMYVRHHDLSREVVCLYAVETFTTKDKAADGEVTTSLRVKASTLERLASVCPDVCMPSRLPASHVSCGVGKPPKKKPHAAADAAGGSGDGRRKRKQVVRDSDDEPEEPSDGDDDPPPPIPEGYKVIGWSEGQDVTHFMLWTAVGASRASWHLGITVKKLGTKRKRDSFTHDAKLDGSDGVRGVTLSAAVHAEGCWVCLEKSDPVEMD